MTGDRPRPEREVLDYYGRGKERGRLEAGYGPLERERTREILSRVLPRPPATVADVGGGAGVHALWLASSGYSVHLRDPVPLHVEQAGAASRELGLRLASVGVGDARELDLGAASVDAVLLLGPLSTTCRRPSNGGRRWERRAGSCARAASWRSRRSPGGRPSWTASSSACSRTGAPRRARQGARDRPLRPPRPKADSPGRPPGRGAWFAVPCHEIYVTYTGDGAVGPAALLCGPGGCRLEVW